MTSHAHGNPAGQAVCDALLEALRARRPDVSRKESANLCAFHSEGSANFAYLYHTKTKPRLDVYFPSRPSDSFVTTPSVAPVLRKTLTSAWAVRFAWHFYLDTPHAAGPAASFLLGLPAQTKFAYLEPRTLVAEEAVDELTHLEGAASQILVNRYERDRRARAACLRVRGTRCAGCDFDFGENYGPRFVGLIAVHHIVPLSQIAREYTVDPSVDLVPLCPNCHLVAHQRVPPFSVEELRALLASATDEGDAR